MATGTLPVRSDRRYGWKPDLPDQRDHKFDHLKVMRRLRQKLPAKVDLRANGVQGDLPVQVRLGSCTGQGVKFNLRYRNRRQGITNYDPAALFIYYGERDIEDDISSDNGAYIRDGLTVVNKLGAPDETLWPYVESQFTVKPSPVAYADALTHQALGYESVQVSTTAVRAALAVDHPVVFGFTVYESFENIGPSGFMPIPKPTEKVLGGHCVNFFGYEMMKAPWDKAKRLYGICPNWWDTSWGDHGWFYAPLTYMCSTRNADDFWTITQAEG